VNGQSGRNVNVTINGVDNKDNTVGGPVMQLPLEAVQEFVISTQRFSAANGRSEGAAINMITKPGTNRYHGSAFGFFREQQFNAENVFEKQSGQKGAVQPPVFWRIRWRPNRQGQVVRFLRHREAKRGYEYFGRSWRPFGIENRGGRRPGRAAVGNHPETIL
jgi:hypothetical protein